MKRWGTEGSRALTHPPLSRIVSPVAALFGCVTSAVHGTTQGSHRAALAAGEKVVAGCMLAVNVLCTTLIIGRLQ